MKAKPRPGTRMVAAWCTQCADVIVYSRREWIHADSLDRECDPDRIRAAARYSAAETAGSSGPSR